MKLLVCSIRDRQTDQFGNPFVFATRGQAARWFSDQVNSPDKQSPLYLHPGDFELFVLAEFDIGTGVFGNVDHEALAVGSNVAIKAEDLNGR